METRTPDSTSWLRGLRAALANRTLGLDALRTPEERRLAGRMTGLLYLLGAVSSVIVALLPSVARSYTAEVLAVAAAGGIWGVAALTVVRWETTRPWVTHASTTCGLGIAAALMAMTGGAESPARFYLFFIVVYAAYFYSLREAVVYFLGCGLILSLPFLYDASALHFSFYGEVLIAIPTYFVLGYVILAGKRRLVDQRERADRLAAEQGALQRVATAVARARPRDEVYALVAEEVSRLLAADAAGIVRFESETECLVVGSWSPEGNGAYAAGTRFPVRPSSNVEHLLHTGEAVHTDEHPAGSPARALGHPASLIAPVHVNERLWGLVGVMGDEPYDDADENRLSAFADLIATSVANTEAQAKLAHQASTDPLTGLLNHRSFHERLRTEVRRAQRYGRTLSLAVVDVDNFKHVNDLAGHEAGDRVLADVAERLGSIARAEDVFARIGGDEFALLLPETDRMQALAALERARQVVAATPFDVGHMTISAGICDMESASDADAMFRLADGALYWSKAHGRDVVWIYDPETVRELSAEERAEHLERGAALRGLRALARAIDAKDPTTRRHSERVAALATELAKASGWDTERVGRLHEAALVHDVGKIGVPDAVLTKPGPLTEEEYEQTKQHAALSTQIVAEVLDEEQTAWVAAHHERPDGRGYPHGLRADRIPAGAALLAVADAWDVMTVSRPYSVPKSSDEALEECRGLAGAQFTSEAIEALLATHAAGSLERLMAGVAA